VIKKISVNFGQQCEPKVEEQITAVTLNILFFHVKKQQQKNSKTSHRRLFTFWTILV